MQLSKEFEKNIKEAFDFWCSKNKGSEAISIDQWVTGVLQKPIFELIGAKRTEDAGQKGKAKGD